METTYFSPEMKIYHFKKRNKFLPILLILVVTNSITFLGATL